MQTATEAVISRGPWPDRGLRDAFEVLLEDGSDAPFSLHLSPEQLDRIPTSGDRHGEHVFSIWTSAGKQFECPAWYRIVKCLPWLKPRKGNT